MRRYYFEKKESSLKKIFKIIFVALIVTTLSFSSFALFIYQFSQKKTEESLKAFYQKPADLIAVFTGDAGRIDFALNSSQKFPHAKVFITGVYSKNTVKTLINNYYKKHPKQILPAAEAETNDLNKDIQKTISKNEDQASPQPVDIRENTDGTISEKTNIEIDYLAANTVENVLSTLRYIRKHKEFKTILIVSSDYHLFRIHHIIKSLIKPEDKVKFYYHGVKSSQKNIRNFKIHLKEVYKFLKTYAFLILWDEDESFCTGIIREDGSCSL